ncbi:MAG: adenylate kinase family protein [Nitrososphaeria archaeon]|nr:adenylate kinase family protein [Nitrososphaeria archaeon]
MFNRIGITGTPATGKKTLAKALSKVTGYRIININRVCLLEGAIIGRDMYGIVADTLKLKKLISKLILSENFVLVGHLLSHVVSSKNLDLVIVLRCDPYTLEERLRKRGYPEKKVLMNVGSEILGTCYFEALKKFGLEKIHVIETSKKSVKEVLNDALEALNGVRRFDGFSIDWLQLVTERGDLGRFFPDSYY